MPTELSTYLCSYCNRFFEAPAGYIDRTRAVRCPRCAINTPADVSDPSASLAP
jgi:DNA-directed RNA polymerase subunit RPC12/RpoP